MTTIILIKQKLKKLGITKLIKLILNDYLNRIFYL